MIVAVTVERLGAVSLPHKAKVLFTRKRSYISIAAITAFFLIFYTRIILTFGIVKILPVNGNIAEDGMDENLNNETSFVSPSDEPVVESDKQLAISICSPGKNWYLFAPGVWNWFDLAWYTCAPFVIILFCNIGIILIVTRATAARKQMAIQGMYFL